MYNYNKLINFYSGGYRPRHLRFNNALIEVCEEIGINHEHKEKNTNQRLNNIIKTRFTGIRSIHENKKYSLGLLHQTLNTGEMSYLAEFDLPLGIHNYNINLHRKSYQKAKDLLLRKNLKRIITFSNWASRSFGLHYGIDVEKKCRTIYPLAFNSEIKIDIKIKREFDFIFISKNFLIKGGKETIKAFQNMRKISVSKVKLCCITNLKEAQQELGDLSQYQGIKWIESELSEIDVYKQLSNSRCLIHPTLSDSFGMVVLEAMSAGCAIIVTDFASFPELVSVDNAFVIKAPTATVVEDTYLTEFGDIKYHRNFLSTLSLHRLEEQIHKFMVLFISNEEKAKRMMIASLEISKKKFSKDICKQNIKEVLLKALN